MLIRVQPNRFRLTAYYGLHDICSPKKGETVMVTGEAGSVGTMVGQIVKILVCEWENIYNLLLPHFYF